MTPPTFREAALARPARAASLPSRGAAYLELAKPRLLSLVLATAAAGWLLGGGSVADWPGLVATVAGTALVGGGANGLNQWAEASRDARMKRTLGRPLPSGRVAPAAAFAASVAASFAGIAILAWLANGVAAALGATAWAIYLFAYTPLKTRTPLNTLVGAAAGAIPPALGWTAAAGRVEAGAAVLFAILFVWQIPHFLAIAWIHREDYAAAGFRMLPVLDATGRTTSRLVVVYSLALVPVAWTAAFAGIAGWLHVAGSTLLGLTMIAGALALHRLRTAASARALFLTSLAYLPGLFLLMLLDPTRLR